MSSETKKWYADGLKFECQPGCGNCCEGPGEVLLCAIDRERLPGVASQWTVLPKEKGRCVFLDSKQGCSIHAVRPNQCRSFPFWDSTLISKTHWDSLRFRCPGIGKGRVWTLAEIERQRKL